MKKTVIIILIIWLAIFLADVWSFYVGITPFYIIETAPISRVTHDAEISATISEDGIVYYGLGYTITQWGSRIVRTEDAIISISINYDYDINPIPYLVINGIIITCLIVFRNRKKALGILTKIVIVSAFVAMVVGMLTDRYAYNTGSFARLFACVMCILFVRLSLFVIQKWKVKNQKSNDDKSV